MNQTEDWLREINYWQGIVGDQAETLSWCSQIIEGLQNELTIRNAVGDGYCKALQVAQERIRELEAERDFLQAHIDAWQARRSG